MPEIRPDGSEGPTKEETFKHFMLNGLNASLNGLRQAIDLGSNEIDNELKPMVAKLNELKEKVRANKISIDYWG